jgi:TPR repeat protein
MKQIRAVEQARISASDSAESTRKEQIAAMLAGTNSSNASESSLQQRRRDADNGSADAQLSLGYMYETGDQVAKDKREAIRWYKKAAAQGSNAAKDKLSKLR